MDIIRKIIIAELIVCLLSNALSLNEDLSADRVRVLYGGVYSETFFPMLSETNNTVGIFTGRLPMVNESSAASSALLRPQFSDLHKFHEI